MCGRLCCTLCPEDIVKSCQYYNKQQELESPEWISNCYEYKPLYNIAPTATVPVLSNNINFIDLQSITTNYCVIPMRWGMLHPTKSAGLNMHTHNARLESINSSGLYAPCLKNGKRCAILATGYYEWQTTQGENHKQPYYIHQEPFDDCERNKNHLVKLAGLYNIIKSEDGVKYTCTILTKSSDNSMSWMHHRMPILLNEDKDVEKWLNSKEYSFKDCSYLFNSSDDKKYELKYHAVDKMVNKSSMNDKKCMERLSVKRKSGTLDSWLKKAKKQ